MRIVLLAFCGVLIMATVAGADIVQVDVSSWTQEQKNGTTVACLRVLYDSGITHQGVKVNLPNVEVVNPSTSVTPILTNVAIETEYQQWMDEVNTATLLEQKKIKAMETEMAVNGLKNSTLVNLDSKIDSISNLTQTKAFLKELTHYFWAKGYFEDD